MRSVCGASAAMDQVGKRALLDKMGRSVPGLAGCLAGWRDEGLDDWDPDLEEESARLMGRKDATPTAGMLKLKAVEGSPRFPRAGRGPNGK